jgi:hypothetical protein
MSTLALPASMQRRAAESRDLCVVRFLPRRCAALPSICHRTLTIRRQPAIGTRKTPLASMRLTL